MTTAEEREARFLLEKNIARLITEYQKVSGYMVVSIELEGYINFKEDKLPYLVIH